MTLDIRALAEQAGILMWRDGTVAQRTVDAEDLTRFARAVLEEAAKVCEERAGSVSMFATSREASTNNHAVRGCAAAIRALLPSEPK